MLRHACRRRRCDAAADLDRVVAAFPDQCHVGVKKLIMLLEMAKQGKPDELANRFIGLLQDYTDVAGSGLPVMGDVPILGALFRSDKFQRNETELVIIATPYLVNPVPTRVAAPTDGLVLPSDPQQVFFSGAYRQGLPSPARGPLNAGGRGLTGPGGFRLD